jgi:hypothetical protein
VEEAGNGGNAKWKRPLVVIVVVLHFNPTSVSSRLVFWHASHPQNKRGGDAKKGRKREVRERENKERPSHQYKDTHIYTECIIDDATYLFFFGSACSRFRK